MIIYDYNYHRSPPKSLKSWSSLKSLSSSKSWSTSTSWSSSTSRSWSSSSTSLSRWRSCSRGSSRSRPASLTSWSTMPTLGFVKKSLKREQKRKKQASIVWTCQKCLCWGYSTLRSKSVTRSKRKEWLQLWQLKTEHFVFLQVNTIFSSTGKKFWETNPTETWDMING